MGRTRRGEQARLAGVGLADQCRVRDRFQLEVKRALFAWLTLLGNAWRTLRTGGEVGIAQTTAATAGDHHHVTVAHQVGQDAIFRAHLGAWRNRDDQVTTSFAVLTGAFPVTATIRAQVPPTDELEERRHARAGDQVDAATAPPIAAIGTTEGYELLAPKRDDAVAAIPSFYPDSAFVDVDTHASRCRLRPGRLVSSELRVCKPPTRTGYPRHGSVLRRTMQSPRLCASTGRLRLLM